MKITTYVNDNREVIEIIESCTYQGDTEYLVIDYQDKYSYRLDTYEISKFRENLMKGGYTKVGEI